MTPDPKKEPQGPLVDAIKEKFGSLEAMMKEFKAASQGVEGSGWGILGVDPISKTLVICRGGKTSESGNSRSPSPFSSVTFGNTPII